MGNEGVIPDAVAQERDFYIMYCLSQFCQGLLDFRGYVHIILK